MASKLSPKTKVSQLKCGVAKLSMRLASQWRAVTAARTSCSSGKQRGNWRNTTTNTFVIHTSSFSRTVGTKPKNPKKQSRLGGRCERCRCHRDGSGNKTLRQEVRRPFLCSLYSRLLRRTHVRSFSRTLCLYLASPSPKKRTARLEEKMLGRGGWRLLFSAWEHLEEGLDRLEQGTQQVCFARCRRWRLCRRSRSS